MKIQLSELRKLIRSTIEEMAHRAPAGAELDELLVDVEAACRRLGDAPLLYRGHDLGSSRMRMGSRMVDVPKRSSGVVVVTAEPAGLKGGRMALTTKMNPGYSKFMEDLVGSLGFKNVVYTTLGKGHGLFGVDAGVFVPVGSFKAAWNPGVEDLYVTHNQAETDDEKRGIIDGYDKGWPVSAPVGTEVLVDVDEYFLVSLKILSHVHEEIRDKLMNVSTYSELADVLREINQ
jgi:hypothetical protein